jgi:hypothetical protein
MKVVKSNMGRINPVDNMGKIVYGKESLMEHDRLIKRYLKENESFETTSKAFIELRSFSKQNFNVKLYYDDIGKQGIADFYDLEFIENTSKLVDSLKKQYSIQKIRLKKESSLSFVFKYNDENVTSLFDAIANLGYQVVNMDLAYETKPNTTQYLATAQTQRIRMLTLKYQY